MIEPKNYVKYGSHTLGPLYSTQLTDPTYWQGSNPPDTG
jgi:hypothetical protein